MSVDTSRIDRSTKASIRSAYQFTSPPMKIGKTFWRFIIVPSRYGVGLVTDYEWLNADDGAAGIWYPSDRGAATTTMTACMPDCLKAFASFGSFTATNLRN